jgi:hypothetical protein
MYEFEFKNFDELIYNEVLNDLKSYLGDKNIKISSFGGTHYIKVLYLSGGDIESKLLALDLLDMSKYDFSTIKSY